MAFEIAALTNTSRPIPALSAEFDTHTIQAETALAADTLSKDHQGVVYGVANTRYTTLSRISTNCIQLNTCTADMLRKLS